MNSLSNNLDNKNKFNENSVQVISSGSLCKVSRIAEGSYGIIYEAKNEHGSYAVKRMKIDRTTSFIGSVKELDFLTRIKGHPFIVELIAISKGSPFSVNNGGRESPFRGENMEFLDDRIYLITEKAAYDGSSLVGKTNIKYCKMIMLQSLLALEYMHSRKVLHRDIKPSNLLWFRNGPYRTIKFCDFGISKNYTTQEKNSCLVFTPIYRAPEVFMQMSDYDYRADVWSLGCVFYELLTGESLLNTKGWNPDNNNWDRAQIRELFTKIPELPSGQFSIRGQVSMSYDIPKKVLRSPRLTWDQLLNLKKDKIDEFSIDSKHGTYDNFKKLLNSMLKIDPALRISAKEAIDHVFFKDFDNEIKMVRQKYPPVEPKMINPRITIKNCNERKWMYPIIEYYYNTQNKLIGNLYVKNHLWYQDRILFQAVDIFDRFLVYQSTIGTNVSKMEQESSNFCFMICLYMSIKYFLTTLQPCSFRELVDDKYTTESSMESAEAFEWFLLKDVLNFKIYRPTVYETAEHFGIKKLSPIQVGQLLSRYLNSEDIDCDLFDFYKKCANECGIPISESLPTQIGNIARTTINKPLDLNDLKPLVGRNNLNVMTIPTSLAGSSEFINNYHSGSVSLKKAELGSQTVYGPSRNIDLNKSFNKITPQNVY